MLHFYEQNVNSFDFRSYFLHFGTILLQIVPLAMFLRSDVEKVRLKIVSGTAKHSRSCNQMQTFRRSALLCLHGAMAKKE